MFILQLEDPNISENTSQRPVTPDNPIYVEVDSTDPVPNPSPPIKCYVSLPQPYICVRTNGVGGTTIKFEGTSSRRWMVAKDINGSVDSAGWSESIVVDILNGIQTPFWTQAYTEHEEEPRDDRSVALKITGEIEKS